MYPMPFFKRKSNKLMLKKELSPRKEFQKSLVYENVTKYLTVNPYGTLRKGVACKQKGRRHLLRISLGPQGDLRKTALVKSQITEALEPNPGWICQINGQDFPFTSRRADRYWYL